AYAPLKYRGHPASRQEWTPGDNVSMRARARH
uniref:Uncharacterized protein n=1 Tax=Aegilops tauschii subsp. strangulata TaxID=200361 RepID=A0A453KQI2_AEGTS